MGRGRRVGDRLVTASATGALSKEGINDLAHNRIQDYVIRFLPSSGAGVGKEGISPAHGRIQSRLTGVL